MKDICKITDCTGCHACYNICPKGCITFINNDVGCLVPSIDSAKCIDCGACIRVCPNNTIVDLKTPTNVYAAICKDEVDYATTTSGGAATTFSKNIIASGGVVYGAAVCADVVVRHIRVDAIEQLERLKGSKYVQSEIGDSYNSVKKDLNNNIPVLFIGTPCQVAGLKNFLNKQYDNLYLVDIVCHGVPPYKYLEDHIKACCSKKINNVIFRNERTFHFQLKDNEKVVFENNYYSDYYYVGFLKALFYQESCYNCKYARKERCSDITIGDFWGFDNSKPFVVDYNYGLSLVMINTKNGQELFSNCSDNFYFQKRELQEAVQGNKQLRNPSLKHRNHDRFLKQYQKYGFEKSVRRNAWTNRIFYEIINRIR